MVGSPGNRGSAGLGGKTVKYRCRTPSRKNVPKCDGLVVKATAIWFGQAMRS